MCHYTQGLTEHRQYQRGRLRWYGHIVRKDNDSWIKKITQLNIVGQKGRGRPRTTWDSVVKNDLRSKGLQEDLAHDRSKWRKALK